MALDKKILSIDADDDDDVDVKTFSKFIYDNTEREKNKTANEFTKLGESFLIEVEEKNQRKEKEKKKFVRYILRHSKKYIKSQLISYSLEDVKDIYDEIRNNRPSHRIIQFIFNL